MPAYLPAREITGRSSMPKAADPELSPGRLIVPPMELSFGLLPITHQSAEASAEWAQNLSDGSGSAPRHGQLLYSQERRGAALAQTQKAERASLPLHSASSSWLNQVERFFALIIQRMIRRGIFHSIQELETPSINGSNWNGEPSPFTWRASADVIPDKVRRCKELCGTGDQ